MRRLRLVLAKSTPGGFGSPSVPTMRGRPSVGWLGDGGRRVKALRSRGGRPTHPSLKVTVPRNQNRRGGAPAGGTLSVNERGRRKAKSEKERLPALRLPHLKQGGDDKEGLASLKSADDDACLRRMVCRTARRLFEKRIGEKLNPRRKRQRVRSVSGRVGENEFMPRLAPEQRKQNDDRQRNANQPQQCAFAPGHFVSPNKVTVRA